MMRITKVEAIELSIPFEDGGDGIGLTPQRWRSLDQVLVRIEVEDGLVGWGEAFSYACRTAVAAAVRDMVAPLLLGRDASDPAALNAELQRKLHLFGRYGITIFAISGADIALWDLKAKAAGTPLHRLFGAARRDTVQAYASLVRYGRPDLVERFATDALRRGYRAVKLHEVEMSCIRAGRTAAGPQTHLTVDVNCAWAEDDARRLLPELAELGIDWLEEPVFPPEDAEALARLEALGMVPIAAGENACTRVEFARLIRARAVRHPQPSVTKVGGVTEMAAILADCGVAGLTAMPHSPYFGPGYWATLQLLALAPGEPLVEVLDVRAEGFPGQATPIPTAGMVSIPTRPGTGFEPDEEVLDCFRIAGDRAA